MSKRDLIHKEMEAIYAEGVKLATDFQKNKNDLIHYAYQHWYSKALKAVATLAPDRYAEFRSYYEIDPKRKACTPITFTIQDLLKGIAPPRNVYPSFDAKRQVVLYLINQTTIFHSIVDRIDSIVADIEGELYAELQDNEIVIARRLAKVNLRAAGALMGVVIEGHLQKVAAKHKVPVGKKNPTISDLNDPLKSAGITDTPTWRKISLLADLRNLCSHKKDVDPTKEQVEDLIQGAEWLTKNVF